MDLGNFEAHRQIEMKSPFGRIRRQTGGDLAGLACVWSAVHHQKEKDFPARRCSTDGPS